jgi:uncharacterized protein YciI
MSAAAPGSHERGATAGTPPQRHRGGLLIFCGEDKAAVQAFVDKDPFTTAGVVAGAEIRNGRRRSARWRPR